MRAKPVREGPLGPSLAAAGPCARPGGSLDLDPAGRDSEERILRASGCSCVARPVSPVLEAGDGEQDVNCFSSPEEEAPFPPPAKASVLKALDGNGLPYNDRNGGDLHISCTSERRYSWKC